MSNLIQVSVATTSHLHLSVAKCRGPWVVIEVVGRGCECGLWVCVNVVGKKKKQNKKESRKSYLRKAKKFTYGLALTLTRPKASSRKVSIQTYEIAQNCRFPLTSPPLSHSDRIPSS